MRPGLLGWIGQWGCGSEYLSGIVSGLLLDDARDEGSLRAACRRTRRPTRAARGIRWIPRLISPKQQLTSDPPRASRAAAHAAQPGSPLRPHCPPLLAHPILSGTRVRAALVLHQRPPDLRDVGPSSLLPVTSCACRGRVSVGS